MRVKFIKDYKGHAKGSILEVSKNEAFGLIDSGVAQVTKDMTSEDYKVSKSDEEQADGKPTFVRPNKRS